MSNPNTFMSTYGAKVQQFVTLLEDLRGLNEWINQDPTLIERYFGQGVGPGGIHGETPRSDITATDVTAAHDAIDQVIFAYDSGAPTQKSHILKMLP
jgi:hypothetical protein